MSRRTSWQANHQRSHQISEPKKHNEETRDTPSSFPLLCLLPLFSLLYSLQTLLTGDIRAVFRLSLYSSNVRVVYVKVREHDCASCQKRQKTTRTEAQSRRILSSLAITFARTKRVAMCFIHVVALLMCTALSLGATDRRTRMNASTALRGAANEGVNFCDFLERLWLFAEAQIVFQDPFVCEHDSLTIDSAVAFYNDVYVGEGCVLEGISGSTSPAFTTDFLFIQSGLSSGALGARQIYFIGAELKNLQVAFNAKLGGTTSRPDVPISFAVIGSRFTIEDRKWSVLFYFSSSKLPHGTEIVFERNIIVVLSENSASSLLTTIDFSIGSWSNHTTLEIVENEFYITTAFPGPIDTSVTSAISFFFSEPPSIDFYLTFDNTSRVNISHNVLESRTLSGQGNVDVAPIGSFVLFFNQQVRFTDSAFFYQGFNHLYFEVESATTFSTSAFAEVYISANTTMERGSTYLIENSTSIGMNSADSGAFRLELAQLNMSDGSGITIRHFLARSRFTDDFGLLMYFGNSYAITDCALVVLGITIVSLLMNNSSYIQVIGSDVVFDNSNFSTTVHLGTQVAAIAIQGVRPLNVLGGSYLLSEGNMLASFGYSTGVPNSALFYRGSFFISNSALRLQHQSLLVTRNNNITAHAERDATLPINGTDVIICSIYLREHGAVLLSSGSKIISDGDQFDVRVVGCTKTLIYLLGITRVRMICEGKGSGIVVNRARLHFYGAQTQSSGPYDFNRREASAIAQVFATMNTDVILRDSASISVENCASTTVCSLGYGSGSTIFDLQYGDYFNLTGNASITIRNNSLRSEIGGPSRDGQAYNEFSQIIGILAFEIFSIVNNSWVLVSDNSLDVRRIPHALKSAASPTALRINVMISYTLLPSEQLSLLIEGRSRRRRRGGGNDEWRRFTRGSGLNGRNTSPLFPDDDGASSVILRDNRVVVHDTDIRLARDKSATVLFDKTLSLWYSPAVEVSLSDADELLVDYGVDPSGSSATMPSLPPYSLPAPPASLAPLRIYRNVFVCPASSINSIPVPLVTFLNTPNFQLVPRSGGPSALLSGGLEGARGVIDSSSEYFASQCGNLHNDFYHGVLVADLSGIADKIGKGLGCLTGSLSYEQTPSLTADPPATATDVLTATLSAARTQTHLASSSRSLSQSHSVSATTSLSVTSSFSMTQTVSESVSSTASASVSASLQRGCPTHCTNMTLRTDLDVTEDGQPAGSDSSSSSSQSGQSLTPFTVPCQGMDAIPYELWSSTATSSGTAERRTSLLTPQQGSSISVQKVQSFDLAAVDDSSSHDVTLPSSTMVTTASADGGTQDDETPPTTGDATKLLEAFVTVKLVWTATVAPIAATSGASLSPLPIPSNPAETTARDSEQSLGQADAVPMQQMRDGQHKYAFALIDHVLRPKSVELTFRVLFADQESRHLASPTVSAVLHFSCFESPPVVVSARLAPPPPPLPVLGENVVSSSVAVALANAGNAADMQTLAILGMSACAKGSAKTSGLSLRAIAPLAVSESCEGGVIGNFILVGAVLLLHGTAAVVIKIRGQSSEENTYTDADTDTAHALGDSEPSCERGGEKSEAQGAQTTNMSSNGAVRSDMTWFAACDAAKFPSFSLSVIMFAQSGFFLCGFDLIRSGTTTGQLALGVASVAWTLIPILAFVIIAYRFASRAFMPLVYRLSGWKKVVAALLLPNGQLDSTVRGTAMFSTVVAKYQRPEPYIVLLSFGSFFASIPLTTGSGDGCEAAYIIAVILHVFFALLLALTRPFRILLLNVLQPVTLVLSAVVIVHYTLLLRNPYDVPLTLASSLNTFATLQTLVNALKTVQTVLAQVYTVVSGHFPSIAPPPFAVSHAWAVVARPRQKREMSALMIAEVDDSDEDNSPTLGHPRILRGIKDAEEMVLHNRAFDDENEESDVILSPVLSTPCAAAGFEGYWPTAASFAERGRSVRTTNRPSKSDSSPMVEEKGVLERLAKAILPAAPSIVAYSNVKRSYSRGRSSAHPLELLDCDREFKADGTRKVPVVVAKTTGRDSAANEKAHSKHSAQSSRKPSSPPKGKEQGNGQASAPSPRARKTKKLTRTKVGKSTSAVASPAREECPLSDKVLELDALSLDLLGDCRHSTLTIDGEEEDPDAFLDSIPSESIVRRRRTYRPPSLAKAKTRTSAADRAAVATPSEETNGTCEAQRKDFQLSGRKPNATKDGNTNTVNDEDLNDSDDVDAWLSSVPVPAKRKHSSKKRKSSTL